VQNIVCRVCGGRSTGFHFDAITCESCKSFFRRNALKNATRFVCYLGANCRIDLENRNKCKKCRLDKCFAVGMKSNLLYSDEQKQLRKSIIESNRKRKTNEMTETNDESVSSTPSLSLQTINDIIMDEICNHESQTSSDVSTDNSFSDLSINKNAYNLDLSVIPVMKPITDYSNQFNELEGNKLTELLDALKLMISPTATSAENIALNSFVNTINVIIMTHENKIKKIIQMSKCLTTFNNLCDHDQLILIKHGAIEISILRMICNFNFEDKYWSIK
ncbi:unnamed protein product, partial [Oppiella nova]